MKLISMLPAQSAPNLSPTTQWNSSYQYSLRAFSLLELLICVVIIAILSAISLNAYNGSLDQAELRFVTPALTKELNALRKESAEQTTVIAVTFEFGTPNYTVRRGPASENNITPAQLGGGILKRRLQFLRFEAPEGGAAQPIVTFLPGQKPQGGSIYFGTGRAEQNIRIMEGGNVPSYVP